MEETIVAVATPPGRGGVGIVRLSGKKACQIGCNITKKQEFVPRKAEYTAFFTEEGDLLDRGLVVFFPAPHSFTGEDVLELQGHGSPVVLDRLLQTCLSYQARLARPGEFLERAFLNDKIDLAQAEAVADLIEAHSLTAARMALRSLEGHFSALVHALNEKIIHLRLYVEAAIDFPEEEVDFLTDGIIESKLQTLLLDLQALRKNASQGVLLSEGFTVVLAGKPNAGKSTLMNALARKEVAIVTDIPGTTRDVMREPLLFDDLPVLIIDTAGLRESQDVVEQEGIKRAWQEIKKADCILLLIDIQDKEDISLKETLLLDMPAGVPVLTVYNKIDMQEQALPVQEDTLYLSAKKEIGLDALKSAIQAKAGYKTGEGVFLARRRHLAALEKAQEFLEKGCGLFQAYVAAELLAEDLRKVQEVLGEITGEFTADDLLGKIFSSFCIGK